MSHRRNVEQTFADIDGLFRSYINICETPANTIGLPKLEALIRRRIKHIADIYDYTHWDTNNGIHFLEKVTCLRKDMEICGMGLEEKYKTLSYNTHQIRFTPCQDYLSHLAWNLAYVGLFLLSTFILTDSPAESKSTTLCTMPSSFNIGQALADVETLLDCLANMIDTPTTDSQSNQDKLEEIIFLRLRIIASQLSSAHMTDNGPHLLETATRIRKEIRAPLFDLSDKVDDIVGMIISLLSTMHQQSFLALFNRAHLSAANLLYLHHHPPNTPRLLYTMASFGIDQALADTETLLRCYKNVCSTSASAIRLTELEHAICRYMDSFTEELTFTNLADNGPGLLEKVTRIRTDMGTHGFDLKEVNDLVEKMIAAVKDHALVCEYLSRLMVRLTVSGF
ncbi:MAG: hypothetical protein Q9168_004477 [Polycauliona sp. 1 TL-2023]